MIEESSGQPCCLKVKIYGDWIGQLRTPDADMWHRGYVLFRRQSFLYRIRAIQEIIMFNIAMSVSFIPTRPMVV